MQEPNKKALQKLAQPIFAGLFCSVLAWWKSREKHVCGYYKRCKSIRITFYL